MGSQFSVGAAAPGPAAAANSKRPTVAAGAPEECNQVGRAHSASARAIIKRAIVLAACWGFPATWAAWLIERGGLRDA
jgi:hypothetical protein